MKTRIDGQLLEHAEPRRYADGMSVVRVLVAPDQAGALPVLAEWAFGSTPSASYSAGNAARAMRKGARVVVHGEGLAFGKHSGQPVVRLTLVSHIEHEAAQAFHEPQPAAIAA